ncbi:MAG: hypothetical protein Q9205_003563 [Flavoplaca limonia]
MASTKRGSKPDFHGAAGGEQARELYEHFVTKIQEFYEKEKVKNGVFQAMMQENGKAKAHNESEHHLPAELLE